MPRDQREGAPGQNEALCEHCGMIITIGEWAWCPHGAPSLHVSGFEPYWDKHMRQKPVYIRTAGERERLAREWNLQPLADFKPSATERDYAERRKERAAKRREGSAR